MPIHKLKKELIAYIQSTNDEELLSLLKEDFVFYGKVEHLDIADSLNKKQLSELKKLAEEDPLKDTITLGEFKQATRQWRTSPAD